MDKSVYPGATPPPATYPPQVAAPGGPGVYPAPPLVPGQPVPVGAPQVVVVQAGLSTYPMQMTCPSCKANIVTRTTHEAGGATFLTCGLIALFGCLLGCCLIPFCIDDLKDVEHRCPNCNTFLGKKSRL